MSKESNREFTGIWIPRDIWLAKDLKPNHKIILAEIFSFSKKGRFYGSNKYLADFMGLSVPRIKALLGELREKGYITCHEKREGLRTVERTIRINKKKYYGIEDDQNIDGIENDTISETIRGGIENNTKVVSETIRGGIENNTLINTVTNTVTNTKEKEKGSLSLDQNLDNVKKPKTRKSTPEPDHPIFAAPEARTYDPNALWEHFTKQYERLGHSPGTQWSALQLLSGLSNEDALKCRENIEKLVNYKIAEKKRDKWTSNLPSVTNFIKQKRYLDEVPVIHTPGDYSNITYTTLENGGDFGDMGEL